jgi:hypothetical protein
MSWPRWAPTCCRHVRQPVHLHHTHQTDLRIADHYTDTAGATDHVFGLCHLLGFNFAPRVKDLKDRKLYAIETSSTYPLLEPLIGGTTDIVAITSQWPMLMRLKASVEAGALLPSTILRKLAAAGPGNALSRALRAIGRIERTLFTLQWLSDPELRQRSHAGLNKGDASNALRRAVFFHRQGEIRDRTFENQSFGYMAPPSRCRRGSIVVPSFGCNAPVVLFARLVFTSRRRYRCRRHHGCIGPYAHPFACVGRGLDVGSA